MRQEELLRICNKLQSLEDSLQPLFQKTRAIALANQAKVLTAFWKNRVDENCFAASSGYGYNDRGREVLDEVYADVFGGEAALVRPHFVSGTHTIWCGLAACLKPGDTVLSLTGRPYDTLWKCMIQAGLQDRYEEIDASANPDSETLRSAVKEEPGVVFIQRSRGYSMRKSLSVAEIGARISTVRKAFPQAVVLVDNCYGEFVEEKEPGDVGADLTAGSLIKNPGGGLAPCGGYLAGRADLVEKAAWHLTAPGLGMGIGAMGADKRLMYQGLFMAPHQVAESVRGMILAAALFSALGFEVSPAAGDRRSDTVQAIHLGSPALLKEFCRAVQSASPVDAHVVPEPAPMVGYSDEIIMAAGTFVAGASSEFSSDAPLREPYAVFLQGGLNYEHIKLALAAVISRLNLPV